MVNLNKRPIDAIVGWLIVGVLLLSVAMLVQAYLNGERLSAWIWERHQNQFSWYSRPLFIIPACYYAYRQRFWFIVGFMVLLGCSLFWFPASDTPPEHVLAYLEWEKQLFFSSDSVIPLLLLIVTVIVFLYGLFFAFWNRNAWLGLLLINAGTMIKVLVSIVLGKEAGMAAIVPSVTTLVAINVFAFAVWKYRR